MPRIWSLWTGKATLTGRVIGVLPTDTYESVSRLGEICLLQGGFQTYGVKNVAQIAKGLPRIHLPGIRSSADPRLTHTGHARLSLPALPKCKGLNRFQGPGSRCPSGCIYVIATPLSLLKALRFPKISTCCIACNRYNPCSRPPYPTHTLSSHHGGAQAFGCTPGGSRRLGRGEQE